VTVKTHCRFSWSCNKGREERNLAPHLAACRAEQKTPSTLDCPIRSFGERRSKKHVMSEGNDASPAWHSLAYCQTTETTWTAGYLAVTCSLPSFNGHKILPSIACVGERGTTKETFEHGNAVSPTIAKGRGWMVSLSNIVCKSRVRVASCHEPGRLPFV
jgi:hypothetical protein